VRQALHIFKKDARYLWYEIALVWMFSGAFAAMHIRAKYALLTVSWLTEVALVIAAVLLIGRLILAEAITGDRQFWVTRPYRWQSLLGAKVLFIILFVNLPLLAAQFFIVLIDGFPVGATMPGLLWSQVLLFACVSLPFAAIAAVSSGIAPFIVSQLVVLVVGAGMLGLFSPISTPALGGADWVRYSIALLAFGAIAVPVLLIQYRSRRTLFSRWFGLGGVALGALAFMAMPSSFALALQSGLSKQPTLGSSIQIAFGEVPEHQFSSGQVPGKVAMVFPILVRGIPDGTDVRGDVLIVSLQSPDIPAARVNAIEDCGSYNRTPISAGAATIHVNCFMDTKFFGQQRDRPLTLHASLYFTLFGNSRSRTMPFNGGLFDAPDGLQCAAESNTLRAAWSVKCRSAFRWPARLVYERLGDTDENAIPPQPVSYSPFPAELSIDPIESRQELLSEGGPGPKPTIRNVTIVVEEPLAHLRRDIQAHNVQLDDFADPSVRRR
jgi:hypothetical protein